MSSFRLSRRAILRGACASIALPVLDAMVDERGLLHGTAYAQTPPTPPVRLITFAIPNGTFMPAWTPMTQGVGYSLPMLTSANTPGTPATSAAATALAPAYRSALATLDPYRTAINVLSGLNNMGGTMSTVGGGHARSIGCWTSGRPISPNGATGPSVDQVAARALGSRTRFASLSITTAPAMGGTFDESAVPLANWYSWSGAGMGVDPVRTPRSLFTHLFGTAMPGPPSSPAALYSRSVLDQVTRDITTLQGRLGTNDRARLDRHLTAVRELEMQIMTPPVVTCTTPSVPTSTYDAAWDTPAFNETAMRQMLQLYAVALACDITRFGSIALCNGGGTLPVTALAGSQDPHAISHTSNKALIVQFTYYYMSLFAYFVQLLQGMHEGTGTVLDNCIVACINELSDGADHFTTGLPIVIAGKGGGAITTMGRHIAYGADPAQHYGDTSGGHRYSVNNLFTSMLKIAGVPGYGDPTHLPNPSFGIDGTGLLPGIEA